MYYRGISLIIITMIHVFFSSAFAQERYGGLALYTLREELSENPKEVLREVANIGYLYLESDGYEDGKFYGMTPSDFKSYLEEIGLQPLSTHMSNTTFENVDAFIADVKAAGFKYYVIPSPPKELFNYEAGERKGFLDGSAQKMVDLLNVYGEKCSEAGLQLLYHNHDYEYVQDERGDTFIDYLLQNCNPEYVNFQMDLYWVTKAGADPVSYFSQYPGRFKIWHVKDMDDQGRFAPVGTGFIDFAWILSHKELSGMEYYLVEQDATYNETPMEAVQISRNGLDRYGFNSMN